MAIWEVRTVDSTGDRFWENVWHVDIGSLTDVPPDLVTAFVDFALDTLCDAYTVSKVVRRPAGSTDEFIEVIVDAVGHRALSGGIPLPLYNTIRCALSAGVGRPGIKYLRGFLEASDLVGDGTIMSTAIVTAIQLALNTLYNAASDAACTLVIGADNKPSVTAVPDPLVAMRQRHRKRKKTV
jgi:hypothetical protein